MAELVSLSSDDAEVLCARALVASKTSEQNARVTSLALVRAEADGQRGHGLSRVPSYALQASCGKIDGHAVPKVARVADALIRVDAGHGFAYPAIECALDLLPELANQSGVASAIIHRSHHFGQAGAHAERLAEQGLVALVLSNSPKAIAFWGGQQPMMGTNPIAFAAPLSSGAPLVIDMALSKVARGKVVAAKQSGQPIPDDWALDGDGQATTDADAALAGSMLPMGDAKGAALVLMVEVLAAALTGSQFGYEASSFFDDQGGAPGIGHTILAFNPGLTANGAFQSRMEDITAAIEQTPGARLPGTSRLKHRLHARDAGLQIPAALHAQINNLASVYNETLGA